MIALLAKNSLTVKNRFQPEAMGLQLSERASTATLTIGPEAPTLTVGDWLRDETDPGKGIIWRVKSIDHQYDTNTRTVQLEHIIQTLKDVIMFGEVTPAMMTGNSKSTKATVAQAVRFILSRQDVWVLGSNAFSASNPYSFNGDDLYSAIETVSSSVEGCRWTYTLTTYPFKLNLTKASDTVGCEMRMDRNIRTLRKTIDRSRMYTRHYPIGKNNLHIPGEYLEKNRSTYGLICKVETDQTLDTVDKLKAWSTERLNKHAEPSVSVNVSGLDLSAATGEPLDKFQIGVVCRVPLPEFSTSITERIVKLSWSDKIRDPESVTVTLANDVEDVATIVNNLSKSGGKASRAGAKKDEDDHAWIVDADDHITLVAEAVAGPGAGKNWSRVSEITVNGTGIFQQVKQVNEDLSTTEGRVDITESKVGMVVKTKKKTNPNDPDEYEIKAAEICVAIDESGDSKATINADKVMIGNKKSTTVINGKCSLDDVTATFIKGKIETISLLNVKAIAGVNSSAYCYLNEFKGNSYKVNISGGGGSVSTNDLTDGVYDIQLLAPGASGNPGTLYKLQKRNIKSSTWVDIGTFSAATSLSGEWSGNTYTVTASPQGNTKSVSPIVHVVVPQGQPSANTKIYVATGASGGTGYDDHGDPTTVYLVKSGSWVYLKSENSASIGSAYARVSFQDELNAVKVSGPAWSTEPASGISGNSNTATFTTNASSPASDVPKSLLLTMNQDSWSSGAKYVYVTHTDSLAEHRIARLQVTIPNPTNIATISTYGNSAPTSNNPYSIGTVSKSGLTVGKYMTATCRFGGKTFTWYFRVEA